MRSNERKKMNIEDFFIEKYKELEEDMAKQELLHEMDKRIERLRKDEEKE